MEGVFKKHEVNFNKVVLIMHKPISRALNTFFKTILKIKDSSSVVTRPLNILVHCRSYIYCNFLIRTVTVSILICLTDVITGSIE